MNPWLLLIAFAVFFLVMRSRRGGGLQRGALSFGRSRARIVEHETVTFDDIAGVENATEELQEIIDFLQKPERYAAIGAHIPKGILLVGPPGTGKTLLARAVAGEAKVPFLQMSGSDFVEMFVGVGAARIRDTFKQARSNAPSIIFIDELDALGRARSSGAMVHEEREQALNQLLVEMDGFDSGGGVIVLAATNRPEILDGALLRPGRFDRHVLVDLPSKEGRQAILEIHAKRISSAADVNLTEIAARTPGLAGADLANLVNEAALLAARNGSEDVSQKYFDEAIERGALGLEKKGRILSPEEQKFVAYHELGHAIVAEVLEYADPVNKVTIVPRGMALGVTWHQGRDNDAVVSKSRLDDQIAVLLGGRAAEIIFIGDLLAGTQSDLSRATAMASDMVSKYGMTELGSRTFSSARPAPLVNPSEAPLSQREHGDRIANSIDEAVNQIVEDGLARAKTVLTTYRDVVEKLVGQLLEAQQLSGDQIRNAIAAAQRVSRPTGLA